MLHIITSTNEAKKTSAKLGDEPALTVGLSLVRRSDPERNGYVNPGTGLHDVLRPLEDALRDEFVECRNEILVLGALDQRVVLHVRHLRKNNGCRFNRNLQRTRRKEKRANRNSHEVKFVLDTKVCAS